MSNSTTGETSSHRIAAGHLASLDGVRALAILMVVALHVGYLAHPQGSGPALTYAPGGFAGVDVFFVLSGYLITTLLLDEHSSTGGVSLPRFYARRAFRLLPALGALLLVQVIVALYYGYSMRGEVEAVGSVAFYASNITQSLHMYMPAELSHTWSLALEEQFYLLWPTALLLIIGYRMRRSRRAPVIPIALLVALVVTDVVRVILWHTNGYPAAYMLPFAHADGLVIGCMLAFLHKANRLPRRGAAVAGWAGAGFLVIFTFWWFQGSHADLTYYGGFTVIALASAAVLNALLVGQYELTRVFSYRPLVAIGKVSYGLYLWHVLIFELLVTHTLGLNPRPRALVGLMLSAAATIASWYIIERPALRLKRRFSAKPAPVPQVAIGPA